MKEIVKNKVDKKMVLFKCGHKPCRCEFNSDEYSSFKSSYSTLPDQPRKIQWYQLSDTCPVCKNPCEVQEHEENILFMVKISQ